MIERDRVIDEVRARGFARFDAGAFDDELVWSWNRLPRDTWLKDGGAYRFRRHSCFVVESARVERVPHRAHYQSVDYNALHGGIERMFEPIEERVVTDPAWRALLVELARAADAIRGAQKWFVEAHQFRIDAKDGVGRPTPEGAHRDGVDFAVIVLVARVDVKGGETRVFEADGPNGVRFTLETPGSALFLDDERVIHETTPIQPLPDASQSHRDTLVITLRRNAFQQP